MNAYAFRLWLFFVSCALAGVQFVYSIQFALGGPLFTDKLKLQESVTNIILATVGPISGFFVQPIVGTISDTCGSPLGRRRPFILTGTIFCALGMALIGFCVTLGDSLGDNPLSNEASGHSRAILFAMLGFVTMNIFVNVIQGPARVLINDVVPEEKIASGHTMVSTVMALANIIANVVGAQFIRRERPDDPDPYYFLFLLGIEFLILSAIPTLFAARERRFRRAFGVPRQTIGSVFMKIFRGFREMNSDTLRILLLYFFSWAAYSPLMVNLTLFFKNNVYRGDPDKGLQMGLYTSAIFAATSFVFSLISPYLITLVGAKITYGFTQIVATVCYVLLFFIDKFPEPVISAIVLSSLVALNYTAFNSLPFVFLKDTVKEEEGGLYIGVLNSACVVAQTASLYIASGLVYWQHQNVAWGIAWGAVPSLVAFIVLFFVHTTKKKDVFSLEEESALVN
jgi:MFS family permease